MVVLLQDVRHQGPETAPERQQRLEIPGQAGNHQYQMIDQGPADGGERGIVQRRRKIDALH